MHYTAFDVHKRYTWARVERSDGTVVHEQKILHAPGAFRRFLAGWGPGSPVAVETVGNWYWIADEIEAAGCLVQLVHARKAKLMLGSLNKTDRWTPAAWDGCGGPGRCRWSGSRRANCGMPANYPAPGWCWWRSAPA